jgi:hypothetical protein
VGEDGQSAGFRCVVSRVADLQWEERRVKYTRLSVFSGAVREVPAGQGIEHKVNMCYTILCHNRLRKVAGDGR